MFTVMQLPTLQCWSCLEPAMSLLRGQCCHAALPPPQARSPKGLDALPLSSNGAKAGSIEYSSRQPDLSSVQVGPPPSAKPQSGIFVLASGVAIVLESTTGDSIRVMSTCDGHHPARHCWPENLV